ncbi:O-antigen polymerase [Stanieria sp. NIES-3757]|nr:O-antigen polymerase [Stanieria sp. NIES-3757]
MLILPIIPALAALGLLIVLIRVWRKHFQRIIQNRLNWGWAIVSIGLLINPLMAEHSQEAWLGLANFLPFFGLFTAITCLIKDYHQLQRLAWLLILPSLPIVLLGSGQLFGNWSLPNLIGWELIPQGVPPGRMSSVFSYANFLAVYLLMTLIFSLGLWLETYQVWCNKVNQKTAWILLSVTLILLSNITGLILTSSRNAWGIACLAGLAFAFYLGWRWLVWGIVGFATTIGWASLGANFGGQWLRTIVPTFIWARLSDQMYPDRPIETLRITQWRFCWELIQQRPLTGWGIRNFTPLYQAKMNVWFGHPHSFLLMMLAETGIILTLLFLGLVGWVMFQAILLLKKSEEITQSERLILFTYILAFASCISFNLVDVTIFDLRINTIGWIVFAAINGIVLQQRASCIKTSNKSN